MKQILFDGNCNFCNSVVKFIQQKDMNNIFTFTSLQNKKAKIILEKFNFTANNQTLIFIKNDIIYTYSTAGLKIWKELGGVYTLAYVLIIIPRPIRDFFYKLFAKYRYQIFGKNKTCEV